MTPETGPRVAIIGAGLAGLAAAYELERLAERDGRILQIDLYERSDRLGGVIHTVREDGYLLDAGPDSLIATKTQALDLCRELGLGDQIIETDQTRRGVMLYSRGALRPVMFGTGASLPALAWGFMTSGLMSWPGMIRMGLDFVMPKKEVGEDESMAQFFGRRLGGEAVERFVDPFMAGIYGGNPHNLSLAGTFPRFMELQEKHRSLLVAILLRRQEEQQAGSLFRSLRGGLGDMIEALVAHLQVTAPFLGTTVTELRRDGERYQLETSAGLRGDYSHVILAVPAHVASAITEGMAPDLSQRLGLIRYVTSGTVFLAYRLADLKERPAGHGFLVPRIEGRQINGATYISNKYPGRSPEDRFLVRCFVGGDRTPETLEHDDAGVAAICGQELRQISGLDAEPVMTRVFRWERSNPQYDVGHAGRVRNIEAAAEKFPGLALTGSGYRGIGIPDVIEDARRTARRIHRSSTELAGA